MPARVSIGAFSRASHLSVKTLRHYHEVGLLEPSEVDAGSGYRYYSDEQIPVAQVIRRLRGLQMPVAQIRSVLAAPDPEQRNRLIVEHLEHLETELAATRDAVADLRNLLTGPQPAQPVEHRTVAGTPAAGIRAVVERDDLFAWWQGALGELRATLDAQGLPATGPAGGLYAGELFEDDRGAATVFLPTTEPLRAIGRVEPVTIPATELAVVRHHGSLATIDITYGQLGAYVAKHAIGVDGPLRETYVRGHLDTPDAREWETEIGWPIFQTHAG